MIATLKVGPKLKALLTLGIQVRQAVLLEGPTGVGKTEVICELARDLNLECLILNLSILEPTDLTGLPVIKRGRTSYAPPSFLPTGGAGILFLDEINRVGRMLLNPCLQLITLRRLNQYQLPEGWHILAACNPDGDDAYNVEEMDLALKSRFIRVRVAPDPRLWAAWAEAHNVHPAVIQYVRSTPKVFDSGFSNPRAWTHISDLLRRYEAGGHDREVLLPAIQGRLGAALAQGFMKSLREAKSLIPPNPEEVLRNYNKVRNRIKALKKRGDTAQLHSLVVQILSILQDPDREAKVRRSAKTISALKTFRGDLPAEFRQTLDERIPWVANERH